MQKKRIFMLHCIELEKKPPAGILIASDNAGYHKKMVVKDILLFSSGKNKQERFKNLPTHILLYTRKKKCISQDKNFVLLK